jgi:predicted  nucleic acid-binding Zn-ribbon protein
METTMPEPPRTQPLQTQPLQTMVRLQRALDELMRAERQLAGVPDWMEELHGQHTARLEEIAAVQEAAEEAARNRRKAEVAIQDAAEKLKHFQQQISLVRTQREYSALLTEIDAVKASIKLLEEQALSGMEGYEEAQGRLAEERAAFADLDGRYRDALARREAERPAMEQQAETLRAEVRQLRSELPKNVLALFDRVHERRSGDAVATLRRSGSAGAHIWHCAACNYRVRLQVVADIRSRGSLVQCEGCRRFLHVEEDVV